MGVDLRNLLHDAAAVPSEPADAEAIERRLDQHRRRRARARRLAGVAAAVTLVLVGAGVVVGWLADLTAEPDATIELEPHIPEDERELVWDADIVMRITVERATQEWFRLDARFPDEETEQEYHEVRREADIEPGDPMTTYEVTVQRVFTAEPEVAEGTTTRLAAMGNTQVLVIPSAELTPGEDYIVFAHLQPDHEETDYLAGVASVYEISNGTVVPPFGYHPDRSFDEFAEFVHGAERAEGDSELQEGG